MPLLLIIMLVVLSMLFPRGFRYVVATPILGWILGSFFWSILAFIFPNLVSLDGYIVITMATIIGTGLVMFIGTRKE